MGSTNAVETDNRPADIVPPFVSVIVPHFNDLGGLVLCLADLERQTWPRDRFEIVVADNASPQGEAAVAAAIDGRARLVIVTASPEILVAPFGRGLGAETVIGTRLAVSEAGVITGALDGPNCRGEEKVARLKAQFGDDVRLEAAYGDTDGDTAMLAIAEDPGMKVFGERP